METAFKHIAALIGDPTRATILWTLLDGKAFTATELAIAADTSPQNISMHLNKLVQADLLSVESQGRHRYYKFSRKDVAYAIEALANLIPATRNTPVVEQDSAVKYCRTCYDHLAGKIGVAITDSLITQEILSDTFDLSSKGNKWFGKMGIDIDTLKQQRRTFIRPCLDWSERRHHLAGAVGAALLDMMLSADWLRKTRQSRAIVITAEGEKMLEKHFKLAIPN
ncbi:ArsR/SmtB family transcription factor [Chitinophaga filiformis]|uniref:Helix-turn-helix domain-containing protein n=1 Tax=Chitinophaga filiformis TaxID=104663 RepID=A0ABY4I3R8_CHIFI|nr:winged helix-turn-helix domain-containing protein [Chitinophaga filiformis]UPK69773.1 helix-turn-helix domain-containing protein [Chitinophaga filiformis]